MKLFRFEPGVAAASPGRAAFFITPFEARARTSFETRQLYLFLGVLANEVDGFSLDHRKRLPEGWLWIPWRQVSNLP
jgi:hypothetical protein